MTLTPRRVVGLSLMVVLTCMLGGALGVLIYLRLVVDLDISQQSLLLRLPDGLRAQADIKDPVPVRIDGMVSATVPINQTFQLPLRGSYVAQVVFNADIPLKTRVTYTGSIPIRAFADLRGSTALVVDSRFLPKFDLMARVPLNFDLPVTLTVPINTRIALAYRGPLSFTLNQNLALPVRIVVQTKFPLHRDAQAPVLARVGLQVHAPAAAIPLVIEQATLRLPLSQMSLQRAWGEPQRRSPEFE